MFARFDLRAKFFRFINCGKALFISQTPWNLQMITIHKMTESEIPIVSRLLERCYAWLGEIERFPPAFIDFLISKRASVETIERESKNQLYLVAKSRGSIVGMVAIRDNDITKLYVSPENHRQSVGKGLFRAAEQIIAENGFDRLSLVAIGESPVPFYRAMGMSVVKRAKSTLSCYKGGEVILMEKSL
jgi:ribosomal protein S18 acetylase RimI-like enzyme